MGRVQFILTVRQDVSRLSTFLVTLKHHHGTLFQNGHSSYRFWSIYCYQQELDITSVRDSQRHSSVSIWIPWDSAHISLRSPAMLWLHFEPTLDNYLGLLLPGSRGYNSELLTVYCKCWWPQCTHKGTSRAELDNSWRRLSRSLHVSYEENTRSNTTTRCP